MVVTTRRRNRKENTGATEPQESLDSLKETEAALSSTDPCTVSNTQQPAILSPEKDSCDMSNQEFGESTHTRKRDLKQGKSKPCQPGKRVKKGSPLKITTPTKTSPRAKAIIKAKKSAVKQRNVSPAKPNTLTHTDQTKQSAGRPVSEIDFPTPSQSASNPTFNTPTKRNKADAGFGALSHTTPPADEATREEISSPDPNDVLHRKAPDYTGPDLSLTAVENEQTYRGTPKYTWTPRRSFYMLDIIEELSDSTGDLKLSNVNMETGAKWMNEKYRQEGGCLLIGDSFKYKVQRMKSYCNSWIRLVKTNPTDFISGVKFNRVTGELGMGDHVRKDWADAGIKGDDLSLSKKLKPGIPSWKNILYEKSVPVFRHYTKARGKGVNIEALHAEYHRKERSPKKPTSSAKRLPSRISSPLKERSKKAKLLRETQGQNSHQPYVPHAADNMDAQTKHYISMLDLHGKQDQRSQDEKDLKKIGELMVNLVPLIQRRSTEVRKKVITMSCTEKPLLIKFFWHLRTYPELLEVALDGLLEEVDVAQKNGKKSTNDRVHEYGDLAGKQGEDPFKDTQIDTRHDCDHDLVGTSRHAADGSDIDDAEKSVHDSDSSIG